MNQEEHIQEVLKMRPSGFDPNVETHKQTENGLKYGTWEKYQGQKQIDERNPLPNEVVIDIDKGSTEERRKETKKAIKTLQNQGLPFYITDSGGTGFHVHLFFQLPDGKNWKQMRPYRKAIYQWIKKQAEDNYNADTTGWDEEVVDCNLKGNKGHLIRAVGGRKIETGYRKTTVTPTTMEKKQVEDAENVEYPDSMDLDFWRMSKVDSDGSDLTWKEVNEAAQEIKEEIQEKQKKEIDTNFEAEDDGLQAARELPATEVLKLVGREVSTGRQIECPIHDDSNPSAKVTDGTESSEMPENRLICFSNTCNSESSTDSQFKMWNGIDILVENGYGFEEAKDKLAEEFDIEIEKEETSELTLEEKDEKIQDLIQELQEMNGSSLDRKRKKDEIYRLLVDAPKSYRTEVFGDIPGQKRDNEKGFNEYLSDYIEEEEDQESLESRYGKELVRKAERLLEDKHILKKVKTVLDHRIAGEDVNKLGLFLQLLSKDTEDPLMIFGIQKQGEGKSYLAKNVIDLFPDHMVEKLTDATKSSIYRIAENEGKDFFDNKIVFFGEIPENEDDREVFQIFRQLNSEGEVQKRLTLDRQDGMESAKLELEGSPAVLSTTVNEGLIDEQDMSRGMAYSPEMSEKQNEKVRSFQNRAHEFPDHLLDPEDINELEKTIECALDILAQEDVNMQNPFTRDINNQVPEDSDNIKRDYPKTLKIAAEMPGYLYHRQRPSKEIHGVDYSFVSWEDVARGIVINRKFINNMIRGRTESTMDAYQVIKEKMTNSGKSYSQMRKRTTDKDIQVEADYFTNKDLAKWMGLADQTAREYTNKLDKMEMVYKDSARKPHRHYLIETDKSETAGVTLRSLFNIIASVSEREELSEWARNYIRFNGLEGSVCEEDLIEMVAFTENQLPLELDIGLEKDDSHTTPLYQQISDYKVEEATALKVEEDGTVIFTGSGRDSEAFTGEEPEDNQEDSEPERPMETMRDLVPEEDPEHIDDVLDEAENQGLSRDDAENLLNQLMSNKEAIEQPSGQVKSL